MYLTVVVQITVQKILNNFGSLKYQLHIVTRQGFSGVNYFSTQ